MDAANMLGSKPKRIEQTSIKTRFADILQKCPRRRKVRKFIKDWLFEIEQKKLENDFSQLGFN